jgi:uncharacterized protein YceK
MESSKLVVAAVMVLGCGSVCTFTYAQDPATLGGKYSGNYTVTGSRGDRQWGLELTIGSIEGENVKGTLVRYGAQCKGNFDLEGTLKENQLVLRSNKSGPAGDCTSNFRLTVEGNKLAGTMGTFPAQLSK